ncbi:transglutaminase-like domain-containing protein [Halorhabdus rudnickae]|uniref:transglutaminase-like domain-containing protein n=1 Tax=Halorhabdus rudnickae TaxID=1775544 RepID=UPI001FCE4ADD|nr:transglutaminase-like domain-containing protein [Halorhabdus rudnickae]
MDEGRVGTVFERVSVPAPLRVLALGATLLVIGSFVGVLYHVVDVISDPRTFLTIVALTFVGTTVLARYLTDRVAVVLAALLLVGGLGWYITGLPRVGFELWPHVRYTIALLTGQSVLAIVNLQTWVLAVTPAPVFLTWYLAVRRRYVAGAGVGGTTTLFFVLTGDAGPELALLGVVGVVALVGVGELDRLEASVGDADIVATVVALVILTSATITLVPTGMGYTFSPDTGLNKPGFGESGTADTIEGNLLEADSEFQILGSLELSSSVRYRVRSNESEYWRVGAYDLYTGDGWIRQGSTGSLDRRLGTPAGRDRVVEQTYRPLTEIRTMPAVWRPRAVTGLPAESARATSLGGLRPSRTLAPNETYRVESAVPVATLPELRAAQQDYPATIADRYLQLPDSTPDRVGARTGRLTANADNPYDTARVIEDWLESNREYSLNVSQPSGDVADAFLFEMERGYCTYYATTMTVMLRSQGIPARMVVGYGPGQRVSENEWVVRGHDAHAWVEVYFTDIGWVRFDPTPSGPRDSVRQTDLETARESGGANVDTNDSQRGEWTPTPTTEGDEPDAANGTSQFVTPMVQGEQVPVDVTLTPNGESSGQSGSGTDTRTETGITTVGLPTAQQATLGLLALLGIVGMAHRTGVSRRAYRAVWLRWQPRGDPETDVERASERLSALLARRHRPRRQGETVRTYLDAVDADDRARRVAAIRERAIYGGTVSEAAAEEAVELVDELARE